MCHSENEEGTIGDANTDDTSFLTWWKVNGHGKPKKKTKLSHGVKTPKNMGKQGGAQKKTQNVTKG